jgi:acyl-CoA synthetase (AMP-forming)/AMP-acid ligase II
MILVSEQQIREYTQQGWWGTETLVDLFLKSAQAAPDAIALVDPPNRSEITIGQPQRLTYAEVEQAMNRLAAGLLNAGIGRDDIVMVQLPNIAELVVAYLACARIGAIISPLPVQYRALELRQTMNVTQPRAFITTTNFGGFNYLELVRDLQVDFPSLKVIFALGDSLPTGVLPLQNILAAQHDAAQLHSYITQHPVSANDVLTICWTSGTEAEPKGVPRSHNHWINIAYVSVDVCEIGAGYNLLNPFPMTAMAAIAGMLFPWAITGGKLVMHHPLNLQVFLGQIVSEKIQYTVAPPVLLDMLLLNPATLAQVDLSRIKTIGSGSAPLSPWMVTQYEEKYGIHIVNLFGSNEGMSLASGPGEIPDPVERAQYFPRWGVPGFEWRCRVAPSILTKLIDPISKQVITGPDIAGELAIKSPMVFAGYYRRPDLTQKCFDADGYFYTGDLFEIAGEGDQLNRYRFVGRLKDLIIRGGMKIAPEEIEALIIEHPKVAEVAVVGYPDKRLNEERICAVVTPKKEQTVTLDEVQDFLKAKGMAPYKLPKKLWAMDGLPRNPMGKILKRDLKAQLANGV